MEDTLPYIVGAMSNLLFGFKSLPQVIKSYKSKSVNGISPMMLVCDFGGNIGCTYYIYSTVKFAAYFQYVNYFFATLWLIVLFVMMFIYRDNK